MDTGYFIGRGEKTSCGGEVLEGDNRVSLYGLLHACEGDRVTCGKDGQVYTILGGISHMSSHGRRMAGTLDSFSSCPCRAQLIPSEITASYSNQGYSSQSIGRAAEPAPPTRTDRPVTASYNPPNTFTSEQETALGISSKSLVHHWDKAGSPGQIPGYAGHVEAIGRAQKYMKTGGYIGIGVGGVSSLLAIEQVCNGDSGEVCTRVRFTEGGKFGGATFGGAVGGWAGELVSGPICVALGVSTGLGGVVCVAALVGTGAWVGTTLGGMGGEYMGEKVYEVTQP